MSKERGAQADTLVRPHACRTDGAVRLGSAGALVFLLAACGSGMGTPTGDVAEREGSVADAPDEGLATEDAPDGGSDEGLATEDAFAAVGPDGARADTAVVFDGETRDAALDARADAAADSPVDARVGPDAALDAPAPNDAGDAGASPTCGTEAELCALLGYACGPVSIVDRCELIKLACDRPDGVVVKERGRRLREVGARLTRRFLEAQRGTVHRALTLEDGSLAVTGNYLKVRIPPGRRRNEWVRVRLDETTPSVSGAVID